MILRCTSFSPPQQAAQFGDSEKNNLQGCLHGWTAVRDMYIYLNKRHAAQIDNIAL